MSQDIEPVTPRIYTKLQELLRCLEPELVTPVCSITVQAGDAAAFDFGLDCEYDGMAWSRLMTTYPTDSFPNPVFGALPRHWEWAYSIELGVVRNYPLEEDGSPTLSDELLAEKSLLQMRDMIALQRAILCCFDARAVAVAPYKPIGPDGGAFGGTFEFNARI